MKRWTVPDLTKTGWFVSLLDQIQQQLDVVSAERRQKRPALERQREQLREQLHGWSQSLAKPDLNPAVRALMEKEVEAALLRQQEVERQLAEVDAARRLADAVYDAEHVVARLNRLADVLAAQNPSRTNLELSLHIDAIRCNQDGHVAVRTCKLGALARGVELLARTGDGLPPATPSDGEAMTARPRRRAVRRVAADDGDQAALQAAAHQAADVDRFVGLGPEWFWEDSLQVPRKTCWSADHAAAVAAKKQETGWSPGKLAEHFGKCIPTIRRALRLAQEKDGQGNSGGPPQQ